MHRIPCWPGLRGRHCPTRIAKTPARRLSAHTSETVDLSWVGRPSKPRLPRHSVGLGCGYPTDVSGEHDDPRSFSTCWLVRGQGVQRQERYWDGRQWTAYTQPAGLAQQRLAGASRVAPRTSGAASAAGIGRSESKSGRWYLILPAASLGLATFVPFLHAASRVVSRASSVLASAYTLLSLTAFIIIGTAPQGDSGQNSLQANVGVSLLFVETASAYLFLPRMRRQAYGPSNSTEVPAPGESPAVDLALAERAKRRAAAQIASSDPNLARELCIGRPDLPQAYDDGGLVDLNSFDAAGLVRYLGLPSDVAGRIVTARDQLGGFSSLDEAGAYAGVSESTTTLLNDRCVVVPRLS